MGKIVSKLNCVCVYVPVLVCVCVHAAGARVHVFFLVLPHADHWLLNTEPIQDVRAKCGRAQKATAPTSHLCHAAAPILVPAGFPPSQEQMHFGLHAPVRVEHGPLGQSHVGFLEERFQLLHLRFHVRDAVPTFHAEYTGLEGSRRTPRPSFEGGLQNGP